MKEVKARILFVDEHEDTRIIVSLWLGTVGYEVVSANCVREALEKTFAEPFDLYLLDNRLPDGTGIELSREIRKFDEFSPIVFYSGERAERLTESIGDDVQDYVMKPGFNTLPEVISRALNLPPERAR
jgi:DNA-binding NtrC family response regulator